MLAFSLSASRLANATALVFLVFTSQAQTWQERTVLKATKQEVNDNFGALTAISDNYAAVSVSKPSVPEKWPVQIYKKGADNKHTLVQGVESSDDDYPLVPISLAINDNILVVGSLPVPFQTPGSVFIFERDETTGVWNEKQRLSPSDGHGLDKFGSAVAIWNNTIVVSSPGKSIEYNEGAIYVFERDNNGQWVEQQKLMASDFHRDDHFGFSLAIGENVIMAGAPWENENVYDELGHGAVYCFMKNASGTWEEKQKIISPNRKPGTTFGWSVDMFKDDLVIGAEMEDHYGVVYFFKREGDQWTFSQRLPSPEENDFAHDVAIENNIAVVSSGNHLARVVFTYIRESSGSWIPGNKIYGPSYTNYDAEKFGNSIDLSGEFLIIGAPDANASIYTDYNPPRAGEAHIYQVSNVPLPFEKTKWIEANGKGNHATLVDIDNDDDLDLFLSYRDDDVRESRMYWFVGNTFTLMEQKFPFLEYNSAFEWIDLNGDGWQDLITTTEENYEPKTELFINNRNGKFTASVISEKVRNSLWAGDFHFADFDNDADPDLLVQLNDSGIERKATILRNDGRFNFTETGMIFEGTVAGTRPWLDFNKDGFLDFLIIREVTCDIHHLAVYQNQGGEHFQIVQTGVESLSSDYLMNSAGDMVWGDYDNDGDPDVVWSGKDGCSTGDGASDVIRNNSGTWAPLTEPFKTLLVHAQLNLVDFNNDGKMDLLTYGDPFGTDKNDTEFFVQGTSGFTKLTLYETPKANQEGSSAIGDIDNDGDVDVVVAGDVSFANSQILAYRNNSANGWATKNQPPAVPGTPQVEVNQKTATLTWMSPADNTTPSAALTYNIELIRNDSVVVDGYSNANGKRQRYLPGNAGQRTSWTFHELKDGSYRAMVQAIDNSYDGSPFTSAIEFEIGTITGVEDETDEFVMLYPNPAESELIIECSSAIQSVKLFDNLGRRVFDRGEFNGTSALIDIHELRSGIYNVRVYTSRGSVIRKIVKR